MLSKNLSGFSGQFFINKNNYETNTSYPNRDKDINEFKNINSKNNNIKNNSIESSPHYSIIEKNKQINSNNNYNNFNNNNSNYKVESNVNVNVNLVTFPAYYNNCVSNEKDSTKKNSTISFPNSFPCFSNNLKKNFESHLSPSNKIGSIHNFPNININNTLPQMHANYTTNFNNSNLNSNPTFNFAATPNIATASSKNNTSIKNIIKQSKFNGENKINSFINEKITKIICRNSNNKSDCEIDQKVFVNTNNI